MKKLSAVMALSMLAIGTIHAQGRNFGLGLVLGDPTGFTAKYWTSSTTALDFGLGWSGYWGRYGYYDPACDDGYYYDHHRGYCDDHYRGRYGYGWDVFHVHADYLFHNFNLIRATEKFPLFYGPGVSINYYDYHFLQIGVRGDFGIAWMPRRTPMDLFLEIAPVMELFPAPDFDLNAGLGGRFYF
jgi:hypothetical protein